ncbi:MAG: metallophosphoesterase [Eubacterium sp.]
MPKTQIVCVAGNHDYVHPGSYYRSFVWSENVHFLWKNEMQKIYLPEPGVTVYGSSYWTSKEPEDVYSNLRPDGRAGYHILLLHGGDAQHRPFSVEKLKKSGFDYIACGHIHQAGNIVPGKIVMAGALEPTDRNDLRTYRVGELDGGCRTDPSIRFRTVSMESVRLRYPLNECEGCGTTGHRAACGTSGYEISHLVFTGYRVRSAVLPMELFHSRNVSCR